MPKIDALKCVNLWNTTASSIGSIPFFIITHTNMENLKKCTKPNVKCHTCRTQRWSDKLERKKKNKKGSKGQSGSDSERWGSPAYTTPAPYVEKWWLTTQAWQNPTPAPPIGDSHGSEWIIGCDSNCNGYLGKFLMSRVNIPS